MLREQKITHNPFILAHPMLALKNISLSSASCHICNNFYLDFNIYCPKHLSMLICSPCDHHFNDCILIHQAVQLLFTSHIIENLRCFQHAFRKRFSVHMCSFPSTVWIWGMGVREAQHWDCHNSTQIISPKTWQDYHNTWLRFIMMTLIYEEKR